jgi:UrcA family protein
MKPSTLIRPVAGLGVVGAIFMASAMGLAFYTATAGVGDGSTPAIRVRYDDLNLTSASGVEVLRRRVVQAAKKVCGDYDAFDLPRFARYQRCVTEATDRALAKVSVASRDSQRSSQ